MRIRIESRSIAFILFACLVLVTDVSAQSRRVRGEPSLPIVGAGQVQSDTARKLVVSTYDDVARRVDSLQFIIVYNAQLLQRDLDAKVIWIYVMLGVMIVGTMIIYGSLSSAQRQRKELEARIYSQVSESVNRLESEIKGIQGGTKPPKSAPKPKARRRRGSR